MNYTKYIFYLWLPGLLSIYFTSCSDDEKTFTPEKENPEEEEINQWIYTSMDDWYLWYEEIPEKSKLDFSADPSTFFYSLLSSKDGKNSYYYSYLTNTEENTRSVSASASYGYQYTRYVYGYNDNDVCYLRLLYVVPGSPAEEAGLKRGDFISRINGTELTNANYYNLANSQQEATYTLIRYNGEYFQETGEVVTIGAARTVEENPYFFHMVYTRPDGTKVAYLMYNSFSMGIDDNDTDDRTYLDEMVTIFNRLKAENPTEFILDMRYNPGGYVVCAQQLASMLVSASEIGHMFVYTKYNDKHPQNTEYRFIDTGIHLNLQRLFVIGTAYTASASEAVMYGLAPYMEVILVGKQTEGKNVGSITINSDEYPWSLQPIVCKLYDVNHTSDYANGIAPDYEINEIDEYYPWYEFGDEKEVLLNYTLNLIDGKVPRNTVSSTRTGTGLLIAGSSIEEKKVKGNIILSQEYE
ncbi:MAG: S41 family peptidase [Bacteroides sp.]|nr:S41 family peptidase [Bacteroides sp.]